MTKSAKLVLEDGRSFTGKSFGYEGEVTGEIVFNTSLSGYQEILTDPSYCGQLVTMTYPLIGNYGINDEDTESIGPQVSGFVVREYCQNPSNWRSSASLQDYLCSHQILGIEGIDTRALTRHIRDQGAMRAILSSVDLDEESLRKKVINSPQMEGLNLVDRVTCESVYEWNEKNQASWRNGESNNASSNFHIVVYDFGVKRNILRKFVERGCRVSVVPLSHTADDILKMAPDGVFLSNGPGDPDAVKSVIPHIAQLLRAKPTFGICLGHQLMALALGGKTYKLKFGHRGANHPVMNLLNETIEITAQNHGFAVDMDSLPEGEVSITHVNLNDKTLEGFKHKQYPAFSVQYHPEASSGPHDSDYLFDQFMELITLEKSKKPD